VPQRGPGDGTAAGAARPLAGLAAAAAAELEPAFAAIAAAEAETLADMRAVTAIPAPSGGEGARGRWFAQRLEQTLAVPAEVDGAGNVLLLWGAGDVSQPIVLAAHLDTVFPGDTALEVREQGGRLFAPGISDNSRGLAALLRLAAVLPLFPPLAHPVLLAATVGEEGVGDLRGVKHLFHERALRPAAFLAVDGAGLNRIVHRAVGSRRLRVRITGPGGHSWSDRGLPNPVHALAAAVAALASLRPASDDDVALNVGRIGGGTSVNAIPQEAWLELDLRSESADAVAQLERAARARFAAAAAPPLALETSLMGDRPGGVIPADHPLVLAARAATVHLGGNPELAASSTDANVPLALGVPAIALGAGGEAGGMHTVGEWYHNERGAAGLQRLALTVVLADRLLAVAQLDRGVIAQADRAARVPHDDVVADQ